MISSRSPTGKFQNSSEDDMMSVHFSNHNYPLNHSNRAYTFGANQKSSNSSTLLKKQLTFGEINSDNSNRNSNQIMGGLPRQTMTNSLMMAHQSRRNSPISNFRSSIVRHERIPVPMKVIPQHTHESNTRNSTGKNKRYHGPIQIIKNNQNNTITQQQQAEHKTSKYRNSKQFKQKNSKQLIKYNVDESQDSSIQKKGCLCFKR